MAIYPSMLDMANAMDPDGQVAAVAEILNETNEVLADWSFMEGNLPTGHRHTIRTGLPTVIWRRLYQGVPVTKSRRATVTDTTGMLEAMSKIDAEEAGAAGNLAQFRMDESKPFLESISQELAQTLFYGNTATDPEKFDGLAPRFSERSAENGDNILDAGGTGVDNRSIWLIVWGSNTCTGIIPKGTTSGISMEDLGKQLTADDNGDEFLAYVAHFKVKAGLILRDWRYVVRIANIDKSELQSDYAIGGANLPSLMFEAMERIPNLGAGNPVFYMERGILTKLRQQLASGTKESTLLYSNIGGHRTAMWNDIPLRRVDKLAVDEARVV